MNVNFGLLPALATLLRGKARKELMASRALAAMEAWALRVAAETGFADSPG